MKAYPILIALVLLPLQAQAQDSRRRDRPATATPSRRSQTPRSAPKADRVRARQDARDLFSLLRYKRFDRAQRHIEQLQRDGRYKETRSAFLELWPSPKSVDKIVESLKGRPQKQRRVILAFLTRNQRHKKIADPQPEAPRSRPVSPGRSSEKRVARLY